MRKFLVVGFSVLFFQFLLRSSYSQDTAKIMSYNLLNYSGTPAKDSHFRKTISFANPDILVVEEIISESAMINMLSQVMNYYTPNVYSAGTFLDGYDTDNAVFYKTAKFNFISNVPIVTTLRTINIFTLVHIKTNDTLRLFAVHLKASNTMNDQQQRLSEVNLMRAVTNTYPPGSEFLVLGDFNIYTANEPAYVRMLQVEATNDGHFIDPYFLPGTWNQSSYAAYHSQSTRTRSIGDGGSTGGLDDRFDFILNSKALTEEGRIKYIPNSLKPFGNDGNHYNDSINKRPNTSVPDSIADALYYGSDHLPVYALYKFDDNPISVNNISQSIPRQFELKQNYPNPFNPSTRINYKLFQKTHVQIAIFNSEGKEIIKLVDKNHAAGNYIVKWNAANFPSGVYYYKITAGKNSETKSMILLK